MIARGSAVESLDATSLEKCSDTSHTQPEPTVGGLAQPNRLTPTRVVQRLTCRP
jgi:hypothetical protein